MAASPAEELMKQGDKKTKKLFGGQSKYEDAAELYSKAAIQYKKVQDWRGATAAYEKVVAMAVKLKEPGDQIGALEEAAKCALKFDVAKAMSFQEQAIQLMERDGKYNKAGKAAEKNAKALAEQLEEREHGPSEEDQERLIQWWQKAADYYKLEKHSTSDMNACRVHIADINAKLGRYREAIEINEDLGMLYADDALLKFNAKMFFFTSLLCHLAIIDPKDKESGLEKFEEKFAAYQDKDTQFTELTHEHRFCTAVVQAFQDDDPKKYSEAHKAYEKVHPLDRQKTTMVLRGKAALKASAEDDLT